MTRRMTGKIAIITGGAGGIGEATGALFCAEGAKVLLVDSNAALLQSAAERIRERAENAELLSLVGDVSDGAVARAAVELARARFGGLNVLVNNAAIRNHASVEASSIDDWNRLISVNLLGAVNFCKAAVAELRHSRNASVVMVSSGYGLTGRKGSAIYDATKAALLSLTRTLAHEEVTHNIRVNAICPGSTATPFTIGRGRLRGLSESELLAETRSDSLMQRWASPDEIAYPIMWLASDEASYMTGAALMVDGGLSIM